MMHVCMITYSFYESDTRVLQYANALTARGDSVDVIALRSPGQLRTELLQGVRVLRILGRSVNERRPLQYLRRILFFMMLAGCMVTWRHLRRPYQVVHVHSVPDFLVFAALLPKLLGARVLLDIHDILPELYASKFGIASDKPLYTLLLWCERLSAAFADHVIVANELWRDRLIRRAVPTEKCTSIRNYPDPRIFHPVATPAKRDRFRILYPGTLNHHQGVDIAVRAFARIADRIPRAEFRIYGCGPEQEALLALIRALGVSNRVHLHGFLPVRQIAAIMAQADLAVVPKRVSNRFGDEAASTKIMEFMALGVPVIASRTRIEQLYFDESRMLFVAPEDEDALAEALYRLWQDVGLRCRYAQRGLQYVQQHCWEEKKQEYFDLLERPVLETTDRSRDRAHA